MKTSISLKDISKISPLELLEMVSIVDAPVDVFAIAQTLPITVDTSIDIDGRINLSGEIKLDNDRKPVIWVNPLEAPNRQRFTMAHELGHLINDVVPNLDKVGVNDEFHDGAINLKRDGRQEPREYAANEFAAQLLMPSEFIIKNAKATIKALKELYGENFKIPKADFIARLSSVFQVSEQAMEIRLKRLGII